MVQKSRNPGTNLSKIQSELFDSIFKGRINPDIE